MGSSSSTRRIARFRSLSARDRRSFLQALLVVGVVRLALWVVPFRRVRAWSERTRPSHRARAGEIGEARRLGRAVERAGGTIPAATCLVQAVAAEVMLRRAGLPVEVRIGVRRNGGELTAHAWAVSDGVPVVGDRDLHRLARLEAGGPEDERPRDRSGDP